MVYSIRRIEGRSRDENEGYDIVTAQVESSTWTLWLLCCLMNWFWDES